MFFVSFEKSSFNDLHSIKSNESVNNLVYTILNPPRMQTTAMHTTSIFKSLIER